MTHLLLTIKWHYIFNPELALKGLPTVLQGLGNTLTLSLASFLLATLGGLCLALLRLAPLRGLRAIAIAYISFFRGVPLLVTLFFIYYGLPLMGIVMSAFTAAILGLSITASAYTAEIIRAGIEGVEKGQWEAAFAVGLTYRQSLRYVVIPQATRLAIPPLSNVMLDLVKSSSIAAIISVPEIFQKAKVVGASEHDFMTMYILVAVIYCLICTAYSLVQAKLERRFALDI